MCSVPVLPVLAARSYSIPSATVPYSCTVITNVFDIDRRKPRDDFKFYSNHNFHKKKKITGCAAQLRLVVKIVSIVYIGQFYNRLKLKCDAACRLNFDTPAL